MGDFGGEFCYWLYLADLLSKSLSALVWHSRHLRLEAGMCQIFALTIKKKIKNRREDLVFTLSLSQIFIFSLKCSFLREQRGTRGSDISESSCQLQLAHGKDLKVGHILQPNFRFLDPPFSISSFAPRTLVLSSPQPSGKPIIDQTFLI